MSRQLNLSVSETVYMAILVCWRVFQLVLRYHLANSNLWPVNDSCKRPMPKLDAFDAQTFRDGVLVAQCCDAWLGYSEPGNAEPVHRFYFTGK